MKSNDDLDFPLVKEMSDKEMEKLRKSEIRHSHSGINRGLFKESIAEGVKENYILRTSSAAIETNVLR
jgi:hypothetical protein